LEIRGRGENIWKQGGSEASNRAAEEKPGQGAWKLDQSFLGKAAGSLDERVSKNLL
jgi:hypothetical protein